MRRFRRAVPLPSATVRIRPQVPAAGVEPAPPRFQHGASTVLASPGIAVPRQGIEPCVCRLKAGGFAIEACEASASSGSPGFAKPNQARRPVPEAGIEPATSAFKEWLQYQH